MSYGIWFDDKKSPSLFWRSKYIHVVKTTIEALSLIETLGEPMIIYYGSGSNEFMKIVKDMNYNKLTFRIGYEQ